ncbi:phenylalanine--tRNA ligase subunit alpha [Candidatus Falkowbacteria bacterium CG10_big_fil_rev_8_21_14_0_10_39_11]|uniref:Phenylalanine--tRNA ligase alpha subunit n=1 Tax=Candidatus Falkowbacteria bacterium CG10_big_fil_rev_8_21_14_0_10_39_11 TaxID=1974565 RepID=A0A2H0V479_9BACT|nr:MAG: phenylalanine--tRNA ligase subunit alpha [Candidatus Falkowbacteria bacterium CG10_big_fil_rev_8_21_14_0_10_39_11]
MQEKLNKLKDQAIRELSLVKNIKQLDDVAQKYFGRKGGDLNNILKGLKDLDPEARKEIGSLANEIKEELEAAVEAIRQTLNAKEVESKLESDWLDVTLPVDTNLGHLHPISIVQYELEDLFKGLGFKILDGPELESDYYNFEALNIPKHHPARDMQDTFYVDNSKNTDKWVMRAHTSNVQVRAMKEFGPPLRAVVPGRVFRCESTDASHDTTFDQLEGFMIDEDISIANLIAVMKVMLSAIFKRDVKVRLRPGYFPFVEPGFELDMQCLICGGKGCSVCKQVGWLEIMGCGMIHPNVLKAGGIDPEKYSGFAFGLGLTRFVMMRYGIEDIRHLNSGDLRFLKQF